MLRFVTVVGMAAVISAGLQAESPAEIAAPFIDEHTFLVVRVDARRFDAKAMEILARTIPLIERDQREELGLGMAAFAMAGGGDVYLTFGPGDYPNPPCLFTLAPADPKSRRNLSAALAQLVKLLTPNPAVVEERAGRLAAGSRAALDSWKKRQAVPRPDLQAALEVGRDDVVQIAFAPSRAARKVFEEIVPELPKELGGARIEVLTRRLTWAVLTIGPGLKLPTRLIVEADRVESVNELRTFQDRLLEYLGRNLLEEADPADADPVARVEDLLRRVRRRLQQATEGTRIVTTLELGPTLEEFQGISMSPAVRERSALNLRQIGLGLHNYHDTIGSFPTDIRSRDGTPLLSWRVAILPYLDQTELFKKFKLDEPWDSDHNRKLIPLMPKVYRNPAQSPDLKDRTTYLAPLGKGFIWDDPKGIRIQDIGDGTSNTIAVVEADDQRAVVWTKPEDITIDSQNPHVGISRRHGNRALVLFADGSVRLLSVKTTTDKKKLWALFTRSGRETVIPD